MACGAARAVDNVCHGLSIDGPGNCLAHLDIVKRLSSQVEIEEIIEFRLNQVYELLDEFEYEVKKCTTRELYDYINGK